MRSSSSRPSVRYHLRNSLKISKKVGLRRLRHCSSDTTPPTLFGTPNVACTPMPAKSSALRSQSTLAFSSLVPLTCSPFSSPVPLTCSACSPLSTCASSFATVSSPLSGAPSTSFRNPLSGDPASKSNVFDLLGRNGTGVEGREDRN